MDPVTIVIITTLFALATGGTTAAVRRHRRQVDEQRLRTELHRRRPLGGRPRSIYDFFWDLGASDFALELMDHHHLLPDDATDRSIDLAWRSFESLLDDYPTYESLLEDSLEAIQEYYEEHRQAGHRRKLPGLTAAARRVIPVARRLPSANTDDGATPAPEPPSLSDARERAQLRRDRHKPGLQTEAHQQEVDLDRIGDIGAMDLLQSFIDGGLGQRLEAWWKTRSLRKKRRDLDDALADLYSFYADTARRHQDFYQPLYHTGTRWRVEANRLRATLKRRPWADADYRVAADVLFEIAIDMAQSLSHQADRSTHDTIELIHHHAASGDHAMAGYLVYLNRHAFFAGRHPGYADHTRRIDYATHKVRDEIIRLRDQNII